MTSKEAKQELLKHGWKLSFKDNYGKNDAILHIGDICVYLDIKVKDIGKEKLMADFPFLLQSFQLFAHI